MTDQPYDPHYRIDHLVVNEERNCLSFTIDLHPEWLNGSAPTVSNWLGVLIACARYAQQSRVDLEQLIEVDQW